MKDSNAFFLEMKDACGGSNRSSVKCFSAMRRKTLFFKENPVARKRWDALVRQKKDYTWPDRPVLFDTLEQICIDAGYTSPLMFLHNSPELLRVKRQAIQSKAK
jgi:hypothetical protein